MTEFNRRASYTDADTGLEKFGLIWKDYVSIVRRGKRVYCLEPQMYETCTRLDGNYIDVNGNELKSYADLSDDELEMEGMFTKYGKHATTGGGGDVWLPVTPALVTHLEKAVDRLKGRSESPARRKARSKSPARRKARRKSPARRKAQKKRRGQSPVRR